MAVHVDDDFARFGSKSYAINKINSVEVRERAPNGQGGAFGFGIIGALLLMSSFGQLAAPKDEGSVMGTLMVAAIFLGLAYWQWERSKIREYLLFLMTSSSETQAYVSRDEEEITDLRHRIEGAMLQHSRRGGSANERL